LTLTVLAANGVTAHFPPAQPNPLCAKATQMPRDTSDNANSIALLLEFGNFRYFDGGDLTWNVEGHLVCPKDEVGRVTVYQVDHHGLAISSNPVLLETLHPQVAIENNGPKKGGEAETFHRLQKILPDRDIYQLHRNLDTRAEDNTQTDNIANPDANDGGNGIRVDVDSDGNTFRVVNERTGRARQYQVSQE
jgi:hypothetical protein